MLVLRNLVTTWIRSATAALGNGGPCSLPWLCRFHSCYSRTNLGDSAAHFASIPGGWNSRGDVLCVDGEEHQQDSHDRSQSLKPHIGRHCVTSGDRSRRPIGHTGATIGLQFYYVHQTERPPRTTRARGDVHFHISPRSGGRTSMSR